MFISIYMYTSFSCFISFTRVSLHFFINFPIFRLKLFRFFISLSTFFLIGFLSSYAHIVYECKFMFFFVRWPLECVCYFTGKVSMNVCIVFITFSFPSFSYLLGDRLAYSFQFPSWLEDEIVSVFYESYNEKRFTHEQ